MQRKKSNRGPMCHLRAKLKVFFKCHCRNTVQRNARIKKIGPWLDDFFDWDEVFMVSKVGTFCKYPSWPNRTQKGKGTRVGGATLDCSSTHRSASKPCIHFFNNSFMALGFL